ncbi:Xylose operon regulatory protein [Bremerella volcania]|uniref:Xylose operon regulatory protein n=1 Tax=Bremerella volcania TaxID=2527984 RepID=A0A518C9H2_9BACT|nr:substrate-binding domain-containing protein [Bremerella volcania]QDU75876.1 Xylose operon regulatory protein [Bremerella volcania]
MPHQIALAVIPCSDNQSRMLRGILKYAAETSRLQVIKNAAVPYISWNYLKDCRPDGVVAYAESRQQIAILQSLQVPAVNLNLLMPPTDGVAVVHSDNFEIGWRLADHLIEVGLRNFAFAGHFAWYHNQLRREGFLSRLSQSDFDATSIDIAFDVNKSNLQDGLPFRQIDQENLRRQLVNLPQPCGVATCHDEFSHEVVECAKREGIAVPFGMSVVGVNDCRLICDTTLPPLSSITQNAERIGFLAAELLDQMIHGKQVPSEPLLVSPGPIVKRRSSEFLAFDDAEVAKAIEFIRMRCGYPITVTDIVERSGLCRKTLEHRFESVVGHSIAKEIRLTRMRHSQHLLASTSLSIVDIAVRSGFESTSGFVRAFREYTGKTPTQYRSA